MPEWSTGWLPVLTLLLGYAVGLLTEWLRHKGTLKREREAREAAQRVAAHEQRAAFQRQTLLDLQEAVMQLVRAASEMHHHDVMTSRKTGKWATQLFDEDLDRRAHHAQMRTTMLSVRVRDKEVRELTRAFQADAASLPVVPTKEESDHAYARMTNKFDQLNEHIGQLLRALDDKLDSSYNS